MARGMTRRQMLRNSLIGLLGGLVTALLGPWLRRGRGAPASPRLSPASGRRPPTWSCTTYDAWNRPVAYRAGLEAGVNGGKPASEHLSLP